MHTSCMICHGKLYLFLKIESLNLGSHALAIDCSVRQLQQPRGANCLQDSFVCQRVCQREIAGDIVRLRVCWCVALVLAGSEKQTGCASEQCRALRTELKCCCANTTCRVVGEPLCTQHLQQRKLGCSMAEEEQAATQQQRRMLLRTSSIDRRKQQLMMLDGSLDGVNREGPLQVRTRCGGCQRVARP